MTKAQEILKKIQEGKVTDVERHWFNEFLRLHTDIDQIQDNIEAFNRGVYLTYSKEEKLKKLKQLKKDLIEHIENGDKITS